MDRLTPIVGFDFLFSSKSYSSIIQMLDKLLLAKIKDRLKKTIGINSVLEESFKKKVLC